MSELPKLVGRLLADVKMCEQVAGECIDPDLAADFIKLANLALACLEAVTASKQRPNLCKCGSLPML